MKINALPCIAAMLLWALSVNSFAFEFEPAVALTIGEKIGNLHLDDVHIELSGRSVTVGGRVNNREDVTVKNGYFAYTPIFNRMGVGEENYAKDFEDFHVVVNDQSLLLSVEHRGFFLGKDITPSLRRVGLEPLPSENVDVRRLNRLSREIGFHIRNGLDWQGFVSYSWAPTFEASSSNTIKMSYTALPQFNLEKVGEEQLTQLISQHCGTAGSFDQMVKASHPDVDYVLIERYEIPISFVDSKDAIVKVSQPAKNWAGMYPFASFACGLKPIGHSLTSLSGQIVTGSNRALSILIVSTSK